MLATSAAGPDQGALAPADANLDQTLARLFYDMLAENKLIGKPATLGANPLATKVLCFLKMRQPHQDDITFTPEDYHALIHSNPLSTITPNDTPRSRTRRNIKVKAHIERLAHVSLGPALAHIKRCPQCRILRKPKGPKRNKQLSDSFICGLVEIAWDSARLDPTFLSAAISHYKACRNAQMCQIPSQYTSVARALEYLPADHDVFLSATVQMGRLVNWLGPENIGRFANVLSLLNTYIMPLPDPYRQQGTDKLLTLAFAVGQIGRSVRTHKLVIAEAVAEDKRIAIHANRRFRWLYFLMIAAHRDQFEYRFTGAFLQFGKGRRDFPACHSILGGLDRKRPKDTVWQLGTCCQTFERFSFFKVMNTTVALHVDRNRLDIAMEKALKGKASELLTQVGLGQLTPDDAFKCFCDHYMEWGGKNLSIDPPYILAHLEYAQACRQDPLHPFRPTDLSDPYFNDVVQEVLRATEIDPDKLATPQGWEQAKLGWFAAIRKHLLTVDFLKQKNTGNAEPVVFPPFHLSFSSGPSSATPAVPPTLVIREPDPTHVQLVFVDDDPQPGNAEGAASRFDLSALARDLSDGSTVDSSGTD